MTGQQDLRADFGRTLRAAADRRRWRPSTAAAIGANDRIRMGVIGVGGMGTGHVHGLVGRRDKPTTSKSWPSATFIAVGHPGPVDLEGRRLLRLSQSARASRYRRRAHRHARPLAREDRHATPSRRASTYTAKSR